VTKGRCTRNRKFVCEECGAMEEFPFSVEKKANAYL
jgi:hypothetical protein